MGGSISVKPVKTALRVFWILRHNSDVIRMCELRNMRDGVKLCTGILTRFLALKDANDERAVIKSNSPNQLERLSETSATLCFAKVTRGVPAVWKSCFCSLRNSVTLIAK